MSGHSKWATTKHKKAALDAKRGKLFAKLIKNTEVDVLGAVLDAGAEEVNDLGESFEVISEATDLVEVRKALQEAGYDYESAEASFVPSMTVDLDADGAKKVFKLIDALEDSDDV